MVFAANEKRKTKSLNFGWYDCLVGGGAYSVNFCFKFFVGRVIIILEYLGRLIMNIIDLRGEWELIDLTSGESVPAIVPGSNYLDLMRAGKLADPFFRDNEKAALRVAERDWKYKRKFWLKESDIESGSTELFLNGVDTLAELYLNGKFVSNFDNAFRNWRIDAAPFVKAGENEIEFIFRSPIKYCLERQAERPIIKNHMSVAGANYLRKPAYHFGWDWGPRLPLSGLTGDIGIENFEARLSKTDIKTEISAGAARLTFSAEVEGTCPKGARLEIKLTGPDGKIHNYFGEIKDGRAEAAAEIRNPELWYPNGCGGQPLYKAEFYLLCDGAILDYKAKTIGIRDIKLDTSSDESGNTFRFIVNGEPIFMKGANYIPSDSFVTRTTEKELEYIIKSAADANMNMLRVWGGGYYESDAFYELCDRYGILVWQDFCFACYPYPFFDEKFTESALSEARDNVERIKHHASLALWCGNNEIESLAPLWMSDTELKRVQKDFFYNRLPEVVAEADPSTSYWASSPSSGISFSKTGSDDIGDTHLWHVWHGLRAAAYYEKRPSRFVSEFGMQSLPTYFTVESFTEETDRSLNSVVMKERQKCGGGNSKLMYYILSSYRAPGSFYELTYLSNLMQAETISRAVLGWRNQIGRCWGTLYWQLNDCWPAISWAGMDYGGGYKTLQYFAKRFFNPVAIFAAPKGGAVSVNVINDRSEPLKGKLRYTVYDFSGKVLSFGENAGEIPEKSSAHFLDISPKKLGINPKNSVLKVEFIDNKGAVLACESSLFLKDRSVKLPDAPIEITKKIEGGRLIVTLKSEVFSRRVFVDAKGMTSKFSQNYFDLFPGETKTVFLELEENAEDLSVSALSLNMLKPQKSRAAEFLIKAKAVLEPMNFINMIGQLFN